MPYAFKSRTLQLSDLTLGTPSYGSGGYSTRICQVTWRDGYSFRLYKEYNEKALAELNTASLDELVYWRQCLPSDERKSLDSFCAFPQIIVLDNHGEVAGIVMDKARTVFFQANPGKVGRRPRHAEALGRRYREDLKPQMHYFPPPHKLALLGVLLQRLIWLHDRNVIVADLNPRNTLITADLDLREVYLLDCDSFWLGNQHAFPLQAPEMWRVGDGKTASQATDLAKFSLLTSRAVSEDFAGQDFSEEALAPVLPSHHVRQLKAMSTVDPSWRSEKLRNMAYSWTRLVQGSTMYTRTDAGRVPWGEPAAAVVLPPASPVQVLVDHSLLVPDPRPPAPAASPSPWTSPPISAQTSARRTWGALTMRRRAYPAAALGLVTSLSLLTGVVIFLLLQMTGLV